MDESRESGNLGAQLDAAWERRVNAANEWNERLANGEIKPSIYKRAKWSAQALRGKGSYRERRAALEARDKEHAAFREKWGERRALNADIRKKRKEFW